jgi:hypothetical protein
MICLQVRRFACLSVGCGKRTFAGQVSGLTARHTRGTPAVTRVLEAVALALGGRAGARLPGRLAAGVSRMTLLRLVRALPEPAVSASPRVLGVGEFALREGHRCGTLLAGVETRRPAGIPGGRSPDSSAGWLAARPGAELTCRDRAGACSGGGHLGAPGAVQVAGRWHRRHNPGGAAAQAASPVTGTPAGSGKQTPAVQSLFDRR